VCILSLYKHSQQSVAISRSAGTTTRPRVDQCRERAATHIVDRVAVDLLPLLVGVEDLHILGDGLLVVAGAPHDEHPRAKAVGVGDGYLWGCAEVGVGLHYVR
jgi:hypothetical protein